MALKQSGIELIVKNADKFFRDIDKANRQYATMQRRLSSVTKSLNDFSGVARRTGSSLGKLEKSADGAADDFSQVAREAKKANSELGKTASSANRANTALGKAGQGADKFKVSTDNSKQSVSGLNALLPNVGVIAAGAFATAAAAAASFANDSINEFKTFQTGFSEVMTLLPELSANQFDILKNQAIEFSTEIGRTTDETLPALYQALSAGVPRDNVFDFLEVANRAAVAGVSDLETSVDTLSSIVNAYGEDVISTGEASDILFTAVRLGKTTFSEIGSSISAVTPLAASLGVRFEDVAAGLAEITARGTSTSQAVTQLRSLLVAFSDAGSEASKAFQELSGQSFKEFVASGGNLAQALEILNEAALSSGVGINELFGRVEAGSAALILGAQANQDYAETIREMGDSTGATDDALANFDGNLERLEGRATAAAEALKIQLGDALAGTKQGLLEIGIVALDTTSQLLGIITALKDFRELSGGGSLDLQSRLFSTQSLEDQVKLLESLNDRLREFRESQQETLEFAPTQSLIESQIGNFAELQTNSFLEQREIIELASSATKIYAQDALTAEEATQRWVIAQRLLRDEFSGDALDLELAIDQVVRFNEVIETGTRRTAGSRAGRFTEEVEEIATATDDLSDSLEQVESDLESYKGTIDRVTEANGISRSTFLNLVSQLGGVREAIDFVTASTRDGADNNDTYVASAEAVAEAQDEIAERAEEATKAVQQLKDALSKVEFDSFQEAAKAIRGIVQASDDLEISTTFADREDAQERLDAETAELARSRSGSVFSLLATRGTTTFEQTIDLRLAFNLITPDEAELLIQQRQFVDGISQLFGEQSIVEIDGATVDIGAILLNQENGAEIVAGLSNQIQDLVNSGLGQRATETIDLVQKLAIRGDIETSDIDDILGEALGDPETGLSFEQSVAIAINPELEGDLSALDDVLADFKNLQSLSEEAIVFQSDTDAIDKLSESSDGAIESVDGLGQSVEESGQKADDATDKFIDLGDSIEDIPDIEIESSGLDTAISDTERLIGLLDSIPSSVSVSVNVEQSGSVDIPSSGGSGGFTNGFMSGGFTGVGHDADIAGLVHKNEVVIPADVIRGGLESSFNFLAQNLPSNMAINLPANIATQPTINTTHSRQNIQTDNSRIINFEANYTTQSSVRDRDDLEFLLGGRF